MAQAMSREYPYGTRAPLSKLRKNASNPNEMTDAQFNALVKSMQDEGWTQPITVVPVFAEAPPEAEDAEDTREPEFYAIVGGHHRLDAAEVLGWDEAALFVLDPDKFDADRQDMNLVKLNITHGQLNPEKFALLYDRLKKAYDDDVLQTLMGFTDEDAFKKLYKDTRAALPAALQKALDDSKEEIKTIDDLSTVLNKLFGEFGSTLDANYMVFSWGGKEVYWVRADRELWAMLSLVRRRVDQQHLDMTQVSLHAFDTWLREADEPDEEAAVAI